jgi:hypothetical protein
MLSFTQRILTCFTECGKTWKFFTRSDKAVVFITPKDMDRVFSFHRSKLGSLSAVVEPDTVLLSPSRFEN